MLRFPGKRPSSIPVMYTSSNSSPLAACSVMSVTFSLFSSMRSISATRATSSRKRLRREARLRGSDSCCSASISALSSCSCSKETAFEISSSIFSLRDSASISPSDFRKSRYPESSSTASISAPRERLSLLSRSPSMSCTKPRSFSPARPAIPAGPAARSASKKESSFAAAKTAILSSVTAPIPRFGTFKMRRAARSSLPLATVFR